MSEFFFELVAVVEHCSLQARGLKKDEVISDLEPRRSNEGLSEQQDCSERCA